MKVYEIQKRNMDIPTRQFMNAYKRRNLDLAFAIYQEHGPTILRGLKDFLDFRIFDYYLTRGIFHEAIGIYYEIRQVNPEIAELMECAYNSLIENGRELPELG